MWNPTFMHRRNASPWRTVLPATEQCRKLVLCCIFTSNDCTKISRVKIQIWKKIYTKDKLLAIMIVTVVYSLITPKDGRKTHTPWLHIFWRQSCVFSPSGFWHLWLAILISLVPFHISIRYMRQLWHMLLLKHSATASLLMHVPLCFVQDLMRKMLAAGWEDNLIMSVSLLEMWVTNC